MGKQVPLLPVMSEASREVWRVAQSLPCVLTLEVPVPKFTVGDLLRLGKGSVISTQWNQGTDVPLRTNGELIGWAEFEVVGERLAARLTELE
jgi:flagellar motor switch/type III secretory pathway protein FliN